MRIAYVAPAWPPGMRPNGIISSVSKLKAAMEKAGHRVHVLTARLGPDASSDTVHLFGKRRELLCRMVNAISRWGGGDGRRISPLMEGLRKLVNDLSDQGELDLLEIEDTWGNAVQLANRVPVPVVVRLHGPWFLNGTANGAERSDLLFSDRVRREGLGIKAADGVSGPSKCVVEATREYYGMNLKHARVIPNMIDAVAEGETWRDERCERDSILFVGRFDRHKGGDMVLRAFAEVAAANVHAHLIFCGPDRGFMDDEGRKWSFTEYVDQLDLPEHVRQRLEGPGTRKPEEIAELRRRASVTVMASRWENYANVLLEAVACGSPLIASNSGGTPEIVRHGENGLLVPPEDPKAMAEAILKLLDDRELAARLGQRAWEDARERFSPRRIAEQTLEFYGEVIERWNAKQAKRR